MARVDLVNCKTSELESIGFQKDLVLTTDNR
jgi:hypothetical protein